MMFRVTRYIKLHVKWMTNGVYIRADMAAWQPESIPMRAQTPKIESEKKNRKCSYFRPNPN